MIKNLRFAIEAMGDKKIEMFLRWVQIVISFVFLCFIFQTFYDFQSINEKIEYLAGTSEIYVLRDLNTDAWYEELCNNNELTWKFQKIVDVINQTEVEKIVLNNNYETTKDEQSIELISVSKNFFEKYGVTGNFGEEALSEFELRTLSSEEWSNEIWPVVAGYNYTNRYDVGEVIQDDYGQKYKIVGFLSKNTTYTLPMQSKDLECLDNAFIIPVNIDKTDNGNMIEYIFSCQFITDQREELGSIEKTNRELQLLDTYFDNYTNQLKYVQNDTIECMVLFGSFGVVLMVFSIIGIVCMIIQLIVNHEYEYAINMLCGANFGDIYFRVVFQSVCLIGSSVLISFAFFGNTKAFRNIVVISIVCLAGLLIFSFLKLKSETIISKIRING